MEYRKWKYRKLICIICVIEMLGSMLGSMPEMVQQAEISFLTTVCGQTSKQSHTDVYGRLTHATTVGVTNASSQCQRNNRLYANVLCSARIFVWRALFPVADIPSLGRVQDDNASRLRRQLLGVLRPHDESVGSTGRLLQSEVEQRRRRPSHGVKRRLPTSVCRQRRPNTAFPRRFHAFFVW